jgi:hypothetical protein
MLVRAIVLFTYLCAVCALPLPVADTCQRCLIFHPFHQDKIAYCQAQNLCPIHDDAAASNITLKIDPPAVPFNNSLSTVGRFFVFQLPIAFYRLTQIWIPTVAFFGPVTSLSGIRFFSELHGCKCNRHRPSCSQDLSAP